MHKQSALQILTGLMALPLTIFLGFLDAWFTQNGQSGLGLSADTNASGTVDADDIFFFLDLWFAGCSTQTPTLAVSPLAGGLGTVVTLTVDPANAPFQFNSTTTANWSGRYVTASGSSSVFTINFSATDVVEISASQAKIVIGAGSSTLPIGLELLSSPGSLEGTVNVHFGNGNVAMTPVVFTPTSISPGRLQSIYYPTGPYGIDPPEIGVEPSALRVYRLSFAPNAISPTVEQLTAATGAHFVAVLRVSKNSTTEASAPVTRKLDIVSLDANGDEVDRAANVTITKTNIIDPDYVIYASALSRPVLLVDTPINPSLFTNFYPLFCDVGGTIVVTPSASY